jgi:hypothetical protein
VLHQLATRIAPPSSGPLTIRGAAVGRVRRNAISLNGDKVLPGTRVAIGKPLEVWRKFVQQRWDPQSRFLNLEVSTISSGIATFTHVSISECQKTKWLQGPASYLPAYPEVQEKRQQ